MLQTLDPNWAHLELGGDPEITKKISDPENGLNIFFRKLCIKSQERFAELYDLSAVPKVFLHGNPHLDNLIGLNRRTGMIDFDRSRIGPYCWDIVRFMCGMEIRLKKNTSDSFLNTSLLNALSEGYLIGFEHYQEEFYRIPCLIAVPLKQWQLNLDAYMNKGKKWAKKLADNPITKGQKTVKNLLNMYFSSRCEYDWEQVYKLEACAEVKGSLGACHYLFHLLDIKTGESAKLIDIKPTYLDADSTHFTSQYIHRGVQMIEASHLYAPMLEPNLGTFTINKRPYWGREITIAKQKISGQVSKSNMVEIALGVGNQLGRAHRRSTHFASPQTILNHFEQNLGHWTEIAEQLTSEIIQGFEQLDLHVAAS